MARAIFTMTAVSRVIGVLGIHEGNIGASNVFLCQLTSTHDDAPVIFDSSLNEPISVISADVAGLYFQKVTSTGAISADYVTNLNTVSVSEDVCTLSDSSIQVPVSVIHIFPGVEIAVVAAGPRSNFFSNHGVLSTHREAKSDAIKLVILGTGEKVDDSSFCQANNEDLMIMNRTSQDNWAFDLESIGMLVGDATYTPLVGPVPQATVATAAEGIGLPDALYAQFTTMLQNGGLRLVSAAADNAVLIDNCKETGLLSKSLPDFVFTFSGQHGYGVRIEPADYVSLIPNTQQCRLKVHKMTSASNVILGDAFVKSGYVELNQDASNMAACPGKQFHLTDAAFNAAVPAHARPAPRAVSRPLDPKSSTWTVGELQEQDTSNTALIIGLTVGGCVLIFGVVAFFVVRKRRAEKAKKSSPFDPSRSMIHDPSEVSSVQEAGAVVVRV